MKQPILDNNWPVAIRISYQYDKIEVFNKYEPSQLGYAYSYFNRFGRTINAIKEYVPKGSRILDIAAAQGNFSLTLAELGYEVTWNDLRAELIDYVQAKYESGNIKYLAGNAFELNIAEKYDAILITEIIEHVAHPDKFLKKVADLVKPGGHIIMTTPLGSYFLNRLPKFSDCEDPFIYESVQFKPNSDGHIFLLHIDEVFALSKKAGLEILDYQLFNNPLTTGHLKLGYLLRILPQNLVFKLDEITQKLPLSIAKKLHTSIFVVYEVPA